MVQTIAVMDLLTNVDELTDNKWHLAGIQRRGSGWEYSPFLNVNNLRRDISENMVRSCTGWLDEGHKKLGWFVCLAPDLPLARRR